MHHVPAAPHVHKYVAVFGMARSRRPRAVRPIFGACCSAQTDSTSSPRKHVRANGLNFVVDDHGHKGATPVILLHGFPNSANVWERQVYIAISCTHPAGNTHPSQTGLELQVPALVKGGFRVIAPDLRGAINGESDAPQDVQAYNLTNVLVKDVAGECML